eukprot:g592.t1
MFTRRAIFGSFAALAAGGGIGYNHLYNTDEGFRRSTVLYSKLGPVVLHYRYVEMKQKLLGEYVALYPKGTESRDAEWDTLHQKYCKSTVATLNKLQGMYTKYGQTGAGLSNTFPKVWIEELRTLEDKVTPQPPEVVFQTIREELGISDPSEVFLEFDEKPLGSASIGQVHRAVLRNPEPGKSSEVAVKVQYPHSVRLFRSDMKTIKGFAKIFAPEQVLILNELERMFEHEFDYRKEADNLQLVNDNMTKANFVPDMAAVPLPRPKFCTKKVLTMDLLPGRKLVDGLREYINVIAAKEGKTVEEFEAEQEAKIEKEGLPAIYEGPGELQVGLYRKYLRSYDLVVNTSIDIYNGYLIEPLKYFGFSYLLDLNKLKLNHVKSVVPPNTPQIVNTLMQIHAVQLLRNGCFNADPHAGNFMLLPDDRIGLIDFGATKTLTRGERLTACLLFAALGRKDKQALKNLSVASGYKSKYGNDEVLWKLMEFGFDSFGKDVTGDKNVQQFIDELYRQDPWEEVPENMIMAQFLSLRLRSMCMQMGHPVRCSHYWSKMAEDILIEEGCPYEMWTEDFAREIIKDDLRLSVE